MNRLDFHHRRHFLAQLSASATAWLLPQSSMGHSHLSQDPFRLGVASGAPSADSVVLWTQLLFSATRDTTTAAPVDVRWDIAHDENLPSWFKVASPRPRHPWPIRFMWWCRGQRLRSANYVWPMHHVKNGKTAISPHGGT